MTKLLTIVEIVFFASLLRVQTPQDYWAMTIGICSILMLIIVGGTELKI